MQEQVTNAERDWQALYPGDRSLAAYQQAFQELAPVGWAVIETTQSDLLALLVDRVEATTGAPVVLGLGMLARDRSDADAFTASLLRSIMEGIAPRRAKTMLATLAAAWRTTAGRPIDEGPALIKAELERACRRMQVLELPQLEAEVFDLLAALLLSIEDQSTQTEPDADEHRG